MTQPYLHLDGITKTFGAFQALKGVSLDVGAGEFVCFLGPSGCGKTTLLRIIAGLERQNEGRLAIKGADVSTAPPSARDFGIVFQSYALFPNLTVTKNVAYGLKLKGRALAERVEQLLALVDLPGVGAKYPGQLSGGQQQRVALARALAPQPRLLLLDEPLSALDARVRLNLRRQIKDLHGRLGVTSIMVTHDQEEALTMADRIVVMNHGQIEQVGTPDEIYRRPASTFVADFVGTMNFFEGAVSGPGRVRLGRRDLPCPAAGALPGTVTICCRPEDVALAEAGHPDAWAARVESLDFLGPVLRAKLHVEELGAPLLADFPPSLMREHAIGPGHALAIRLASDQLHVFHPE